MAQTLTSATEIEPRWIRPSRWQALTGMSHGETYRRLWAGELHAVQVGRCWHIDADEVSSFFDRAAERTAQSAA